MRVIRVWIRLQFGVLVEGLDQAKAETYLGPSPLTPRPDLSQVQAPPGLKAGETFQVLTFILDVEQY